MSYFKYTNLDGVVEEEFTFESEALELFSARTMSSLPMWSHAAGNEDS